MDTKRLTPAEESARKRRSVMIALALVAFVALVFAVTLARLGASVLERPL